MAGIANALLFENLGYSLLWVICCAFCIWFHSIPETGHKRDLTVCSIFFAFRSISTFCSLWDRIYGSTGSGAFVHWTSGFMAYLMILYILTSYGNVVITLLRTERLERDRVDSAQDEVSTSTLLTLASANTRSYSGEILARWEARRKVH